MSFIYLFTKEIFVEYLLYACADTVLHVGNTEMNVMNKALFSLTLGMTKGDK